MFSPDSFASISSTRIVASTAAGDAENVLVERGIEGGASERAEELERGADGIAAEQPFGEAAARLLLDEELEAVGAPRKVDHRIAAHAGQPGRRNGHELPG